MKRTLAAAVLAIAVPFASWALPPPGAAELWMEDELAVEMQIDGLFSSVRVRRDAEDVPHIFAHNDRDAMFMLGYLHAQDRFFQMDVQRRLFSGTLAELLGPDALASDVQLRTLGLRRAAEATWPLQGRVAGVWLRSYARGVNAYLKSNPLPIEYAALELTAKSVPPWTVVDSLVMAKGIAMSLAFDLSDIDLTIALTAFQTAGSLVGFDGTALFFEDLYRAAPFDATVSIPGTLESRPSSWKERLGASPPDYLTPKAVELARRYRQRAARVPLLARALERPGEAAGSNWWLAHGSITESGNPILANDPHLALDTPATFYRAQVRVAGRSDVPPMNVFGESFAGLPGFILGCNPWICWRLTNHPMDVTDVYMEQLVVDPMSGLPTHTAFDGALEPVVLIPQNFLFNVIGDLTPDNMADAGVGPMEGGLTIVVPRRNDGPIIDVDLSDPMNVTGLSVQYTGFGPTRELDTLAQAARAADIDELVAALQYFDVGSQNWAYADLEGNIAYFTSGELPLREDLQILGYPDGGVPPFMIRDGSHTLQHEWLLAEKPDATRSLPYEILPFDEMPQEVNPDRGYILNANNDPVGTAVDNDPLNQLRPAGGLYYLGVGYARGFRIGRIQRLFDDLLAGGGPLTRDQLQGCQCNHRLLDAEVLTPYITGAFDRADASDCGTLAALAADPDIEEAVERLRMWDFSTPTGIAQGYDPGDDPLALPEPDAAEIANSVAATIYSVWRGQMIRRSIDDALAAFGLDDYAPGSDLAVSALRNLLENGGVAASAFPFFPPADCGAKDLTTSAEAVDLTVLRSLRGALDLLASDDFAAAFQHSTDQDDYRWGYLHRIVFDHPMGGPFSIPPGGGLADVGAELPGVARPGGFGTVDASSHSARADSADEFRFGSGPARRFVGELAETGPLAFDIIPGGQSGVPGSPHQIDQLLLWLTNQLLPWAYRPDDVVAASVGFEVFVP